MNKQANWSMAGVMALSMALGCDARWHLIGEGGAAHPRGGAGGQPTTMGSTGGAPSGGSGSGGATGMTPAPRPLASLTTAREAVTRMARLLWESPPDAALLNDADTGALATTEDVRQLALRMQRDPRARVGVGGFYRWWLNLDRLPSVAVDPLLFPRFNADLASAMAAETETYGVAVTLGSRGTFTLLLTAPYSYLNEELANLYGVSGVAGTALRATQLDPGARSGLFTQGSFLTLNARAGVAPILRGKFISERVLCHPIAPPPANVPVDVPAPLPPGMTRRQRLTTILTDPSCVACHHLLEGIGYAYEHYDDIGQYRSTDNGNPVDSSIRLPGDAITLQNAVQLAAALAVQPDAQVCMSRNWLSFALGRELVMTNTDDAAVADAHRWFTASGFVLQELIAGVVQTDAFLTGPSVCTPGADQTCNNDPSLSSLRGTCTAAARCVCNGGGLTSPLTGRCI